MNDDELRALVVEAGLGRIADVIVRQARPSIRLRAHGIENEDVLPIRASKIGGSPDLPPSVEWPKHNDFPLAFVAQINLRDVVDYDVEKLLPQSGILLFFYDYDYIFRGRDEWDADFDLLVGDPANWRVFYFDADGSSFERRTMPLPWPESEEGTGPFPACRVEFTESITIPDVFVSSEQFAFTDDESDSYYDVQVQLRGTEGDSCSRMLGYSDDIQGHHERLQEGEILLLELGSEDDTGMMWGDGGNLYFIISADALAHRDFDAVRFTLESG